VALEFSPATRRDQPAVIDLLDGAFAVSPAGSFANTELLEWKYFGPHPDWNGSRSFVLRQGEKIVAHGCLFPVTLLSADGEIQAHHLIDWAASRGVPGVGLRLLRELARLSPALLTIGGSEQTRQILPKVGYRQQGTLEFYVRPVRPWRLFRADPVRRGWKQPLRLLRNAAWSLSPLPKPAEGWTAAPVSCFDASLDSLCRARSGRSFVSARRSPALLNYLLGCPGAALSAFLLRCNGMVRGWFLLSRIGGQGRIADVWVDSESAGDWQAAYVLAARAAAGDSGTLEIVAVASTPLAREVLTGIGFHHRGGDPIFLHDPKGLLAGAVLNLNLVDGDAVWLHDPSYPFRT
jgi:hypothetical protein